MYGVMVVGELGEGFPGLSEFSEGFAYLAIPPSGSLGWVDPTLTYFLAGSEGCLLERLDGKIELFFGVDDFGDFREGG